MINYATAHRIAGIYRYNPGYIVWLVFFSACHLSSVISRATGQVESRDQISEIVSQISAITP